MILWDIIRDFFVNHVFGGTDSWGNEVSGLWGYGMTPDGVTGFSGDALALPLNGYGLYGEGEITYINACDWLSTTATIITLCLLLFAVFLGIKFLFKLVAGSFLKIGE